MSLTPELRERYSRMLVLKDFSEENMESIIRSTVSVVGAGGLGSPSLRLLSAIGFGKLRIIDRDIVELSNIQRQTVFDTSDIGLPKAEAAASNLERMNPEVEYETVSLSLDEGNAIDILKGSDLILDGLDSFHSRRILNKASITLKIPYVFAGAIEYYANLSTFIPGRTGCLECLVGDATDDPDNTCAQVGVSPTLLSIAASIEVREAVLLATGKEPKLMNRLMTVDIDDLSFDFFDITKSETCPTCSVLTPEIPKATNKPRVIMLCSGNYSVTPTEMLTLDLDSIAERIGSRFTVTRRKRFLQIETESGPSVTLMRRGSAVVKDVKSPEEALETYLEIMNY
ncbi:MAG: HesA/MoeB/ThiF family protein [Candidatus Thorarchaeota archaeon]|nr:MAG: HesA/MoeB/ThiF family protein [Candidatus Thorarchaeota archaeon]